MKTEARIVSLYREKYDGINFSHFTEKLNEEEYIKYTYRTLHRIHQIAEETMGRQGGLETEQAAVRQAAKDRRQHLQPVRPIITEGRAPRGRRRRRLDGHESLARKEGDAEGILRDDVAQIIDKYGITESLHDDRKPVFYFQKVSEKEKTVDRDAHISLMRMCKQHGIELITTLRSQAKGRIREVRAIA